MKKSPFEPSCHYDYPNKCNCSEKDCFDTTFNRTNSEKIVFINPPQQDDNTSINALDEEWKNTIQHHKKSPNSHSSANT